MRHLRTLTWPLLLAPVVAACDGMVTQANPAVVLATAKAATVVTTLAEWQSAIAGAEKGDRILVQGTIAIPGGQEVFLSADHVTIAAATPGSGLRGVHNGGGAGPLCLVCLAATADKTTVDGLVLDGVFDGNGQVLNAATFDGSDPLEHVRFTNNRIVCNGAGGCSVHVFFLNAPKARFEANTLTGQPGFSAIQIQGASTNGQIIDNSVEYSGPQGGIRIRAGSDGAHVRGNVIQSASTGPAIHVAAAGGHLQGNTISMVGPAVPSCRDVTTGTGTAGTANKWKDNQAPVASDPAGLCGPNP